MIESENQFGVIFDMDGVIIDSFPYHLESTKIYIRQMGFDISDQVIRDKYFGRTNKDWISELHDGKLSLPQLKQMGEEKEAIYRSLYEKDIQAVPGLHNFLELLKSKQVKIGLGTSAPRSNVRFVTGKLQIFDYFDAILDESHVTNGKPDPEIYLKVAEALDLPNHKCIVIEDSNSGIESARRAGSKVIGMATTHSREELPLTDLTIDDFTQLQWDDLKALIK